MHSIQPVRPINGVPPLLSLSLSCAVVFAFLAAVVLTSSKLQAGYPASMPAALKLPHSTEYTGSPAQPSSDALQYEQHAMLAMAVVPKTNGTQRGRIQRSEKVNVNLFLRSDRMSNESTLAELQMQPFFNMFNSRLFIDSSINSVEKDSETNHVIDSNIPTSVFAGVGFPHIETSDRPEELRYKPYRQLVSITYDDGRTIVPQVQCMGLSAERVAKRAAKYEKLILELALKNQVSASLVKAVITKESCFNESARSRVGAIGLMQLMPETARWLKVKKPENPEQNLTAGVRYLAQMRKRFGSDELALAAYNAGPGNVERFNGIPPFDETQRYVKDVMHFYRGYVATTRFVNALNDI